MVHKVQLFRSPLTLAVSIFSAVECALIYMAFTGRKESLEELLFLLCAFLIIGMIIFFTIKSLRITMITTKEGIEYKGVFKHVYLKWDEVKRMKSSLASGAIAYTLYGEKDSFCFIDHFNDYDLILKELKKRNVPSNWGL